MPKLDNTNFISIPQAFVIKFGTKTDSRHRNSTPFGLNTLCYTRQNKPTKLGATCKVKVSRIVNSIGMCINAN